MQIMDHMTQEQVTLTNFTISEMFTKKKMENGM